MRTNRSVAALLLVGALQAWQEEGTFVQSVRRAHLRLGQSVRAQNDVIG